MSPHPAWGPRSLIFGFKYPGEPYSLKESRYADHPNFTENARAQRGRDLPQITQPHHFKLHPRSKQTSDVSKVAPRPG